MLVLVTGRSGVGKSAVRAELLRRGHVAYGTDEDGISTWRDTASGREYGFQRERLEEISEQHADEVAFICGTAGGERANADLFAAVICLVAPDEDVIRRRILQRTDNDFGKGPGELERILEGVLSGVPCPGHPGDTTIDGLQPLTSVVDEILRVARSL